MRQAAEAADAAWRSVKPVRAVQSGPGASSAEAVSPLPSESGDSQHRFGPSI